MRQHTRTILVRLGVDALKVNYFLHVGDDLAKMELEPLVKEADVGSEGNAASDVADDGSEVWLRDRLFPLGCMTFLRSRN
jgi:hypothetical protein